MNHRSIITFYLTALAIPLATGCKKFVDPGPPPTQLVSQTVYDNEATAAAAVNGIYSKMMESPGFANWHITLYAGLSADEYINYAPTAEQVQLYTNSLNAQNSNVYSFWSEAYSYIYMTNAVLEGLGRSTGVSAAVKSRLGAEAKFIRAFCYFYLVNFYGPVPLALSTDYQTNNRLTRSPADSVYAQITADLESSVTALPTTYDPYGGSRARATSWAAYALLSRVYLYTGKWQAAEAAASRLLEGNSLFRLEDDLSMVFTPSSQEAIWQLAAVSPYTPTYDGYFNILTTAPSSQALRPALLDSFEAADLRKQDWISSYQDGTGTYYFAFKYKVQTIAAGTAYPEQTTVLRLGELYLIRAEARLQQSDLAGAVSDINAIRNRAGLSPFSSNDPAAIGGQLLRQRQLELFCEWGQRWLDLKRLSLTASVLTATKGKPWSPGADLYPIPRKEITNNSHLTQNDGYQ